MKQKPDKRVLETSNISSALGCPYSSAYHITMHLVSTGIVEKVGRVYDGHGGNRLLFAFPSDFSSKIGEAFAGLVALVESGKPTKTKTVSRLGQYKRLKKGQRGREFLCEPHRDALMALVADGHPRARILQQMRALGFKGSIWTMNAFIRKELNKCPVCPHCKRPHVHGREPRHTSHCPGNRALV